MKILLDTHIWLWYLAGSVKFPKKFLYLIEDKKNETWISAITVWETILLGEKKKIKVTPNPIVWVRKALLKTCFKEAPINHQVALKSREIILPHKDPADRFLAATAIIFDLKLATVDSTLLKAKKIPVIHPD